MYTYIVNVVFLLRGQRLRARESVEGFVKRVVAGSERVDPFTAFELLSSEVSALEVRCKNSPP